MHRGICLATTVGINSFLIEIRREVWKKKKERWLNYLALTTVILALGATLSTLRVGSFSNRSILRQTQASDQWAYYQAKSIKGYLYEIQKEKLELELKLVGNSAPKSTLDEYEKKILSYDKNKKI
jgi:hypothetical protein